MNGLGLLLFQNDHWVQRYAVNCTLHPMTGSPNAPIGVMYFSFGIICEILDSDSEFQILNPESGFRILSSGTGSRIPEPEVEAGDRKIQIENQNLIRNEKSLPSWHN
uniref:Uncharacterized protein n=2 Tax=Acrobeloides nanus TaxID=290746 RepID=A0A914E4S4_9BILA